MSNVRKNLDQLIKDIDDYVYSGLHYEDELHDQILSFRKDGETLRDKIGGDYVEPTPKKFKIIVEQQGWRLGFFEVDGLTEEDVKQRYQTTDDLDEYEGVIQSDNWYPPQYTVGVTVTDVEEVKQQ